MTTEKKIGIWMDHASAHLTEFPANPVATLIIESKFTHREKGSSLNKSEHLMHNQEQHQQSEYYKQLSEIMKNYDAVLLFGPTSAKAELMNIVRADHRFDKIDIEVKQTDKMNEHEQHTFVKEYFSRQN